MAPWPLCDHEPTTPLADELTKGFTDLAREAIGPGFDAWLTQSTTSGITKLDRFARGFPDDQAAVEAGLSLEWRSGQAEGQSTN